MACTGCSISKGKSDKLDQIIIEAKAYAREHGQTVAYWKCGGKYLFAEANAAIAKGIAGLQFVSKYQ